MPFTSCSGLLTHKLVHMTGFNFDLSTNFCVNKQEKEVKGILDPANADGLTMLKAGSVEQPVLQKKGDDLRIDWGYVYVAAPQSENVEQSVASPQMSIDNF